VPLLDIWCAIYNLFLNILLFLLLFKNRVSIPSLSTPITTFGHHGLEDIHESPVSASTQSSKKSTNPKKLSFVKSLSLKIDLKMSFISKRSN